MFKEFFAEKTQVKNNYDKITKKYFVEYNPEDYGYSYGESQDSIYEYNKANPKADISTISYTSQGGSHGFGDVYYVLANDKNELKNVMGWLGSKYPNIQKR